MKRKDFMKWGVGKLAITKYLGIRISTWSVNFIYSNFSPFHLYSLTLIYLIKFCLELIIKLKTQLPIYANNFISH